MTLPERAGATGTATAAETRARDRTRLLIVALGALALCALYAACGYFSSDFWEHAAVVRELAARPLSPTHPLFAIDAPHAYESPYLLAVALAARALGVSALAALAVAGLLNIVLLVLAFRRFLVRLPQGAAAAPYALLFVIFLWGKDPWMWSGFLHIGMLGYDAAYPSTFAAAAMFLGLSLLLDALDRGRSRAFVGLALLVALCVLTHPPTAVVLMGSLAALFLARARDRVFAQGIRLVGAGAAGVALAIAWPYFPVLSLLAAEPPEFHSWSGVFYQYQEIPAQVWPAIAALPVLGWRLRADRRDPLVLIVAVLGAIYVLGALTDRYGVGRVIAYIVLFIQVALAFAVSAWERHRTRRAWLVPAGTLVALLALVAYDRPPLPRFLRGQPPIWPQVAAMLHRVRPGEVVMADAHTSYLIPALSGGRVVAWRHPVYWVADHAERREAQARFFGEAGDAERRAVIARYRVRWVLLNPEESRLTRKDEASLLGLGCVAEARRGLILLDAADACPPE